MPIHSIEHAKQVLRDCDLATEEARPGCHCEYGHIDCSYKPGGECQDEAFLFLESQGLDPEDI